MSKHVSAHLVVRWCAAAAIALAVASTASYSHANGRVVDLQKRAAGPYEVALGTIPSPPTVGAVHLSITVTDTERGAPVLDAGVTVSGTGPGADKPDVGPLEATNSPTDPVYYEAAATVERLGLWTFTVTVDADLGTESADFVLEVVEVNPLFQIFTWVTVLVFFALVGLGLVPFVREKLRRRSVRRKRRKTA